MKRILGGLLAFLVAATLGLVAPSAARADATVNNSSIKVSATRLKNGKALSGQRLSPSSRVFVWVEDAPRVKQMRFSLDGNHVRNENKAPWELHGGESFDVSSLGLGQHRIDVEVRFTSGKPLTLSATFTVGEAPGVGNLDNRSIVFSPTLHKNPTVLFGKTLGRADKVHVWLEAPASLKQVVFDLDGKAVNLETKHPWDMVREGSTLDLSGLADGKHTIHAKVTLADDSTRLLTAHFRVSASGGNGPKPTASAKPTPSPKPTVSASPTTRPVTGKPTLQNTGPRKGIKLRKSGTIKVRKNGAVIENLDIRGFIVVKAHNVTIRNVRIHATTKSAAINIDKGFSGTMVEHVAIKLSGRMAAGGISVGGDYAGKHGKKPGDNITVRHTSIVGSGDGIKCMNWALYEHNYISMQAPPHAKDPHVDGIQCSGRSGIIIRHNSIPQNRARGANAAVFIQAYQGQHHNKVRDVEVYGNWLDGGSYSFHSEDHKKGKELPVRRWLENVHVHDNFFGRNYRYAPYSFKSGVHGNAGVWEDTGKPVKK